jgi:hypothetical protein
MIFFCCIKIAEGFQTDEDLLTAVRLKLPDARFGDQLLLRGKIIDRQGIGMTPVDKLTAGIIRVYAAEESIKQLPVGDGFRIVFNTDRFPMACFLKLNILVDRIDFSTAGITADHPGDTSCFPECGRDTPETAGCEICLFHSFHRNTAL